MAVYNRSATVAYDVQNISILSVESLGPATPVAIPGSDFKLYVDIVMGQPGPALNITANQTGLSAAQSSFGYGIGYLLRAYLSDYETYLDGGVSVLRGFLSVPFQFSTAAQQAVPLNDMPSENLVTASLSNWSYRAIIDTWTVWVFGALSLILTLWCVLALIWITWFGPPMPHQSVFPEINITSKSSLQEHNASSAPEVSADMDPHLELTNEKLEDLSSLTRSCGLGNAPSAKVVKSIHGKRLYCGSLPSSRDGERVIVLVTEGGQLTVLNKRQKYL